MKKAFSLIELIIVIVIIGVVYTLAIGNFQKTAEESGRVKLETLKEYLQKFPHVKSVKFLCLDECSGCDIFVDGKKQIELEGEFDGFLDKSIKVYRYDFFQGMFEQQKEVYFNNDNVEKNVCFSYSVDEKGVGEQVFVEFGGLVYDFSTYLTPISIYKSFQEAIDAKEKLIQELLR